MREEWGISTLRRHFSNNVALSYTPMASHRGTESLSLAVEPQILSSSGCKSSSFFSRLVLMVSCAS